MINLLRKLGFLFCDWIDDLVDEFNDLGITETEFYYWICGDDGVLLKVRKHDYLVDKVEISISNNFKSVSFIDNLNGVIVGDLKI